MHLLDTLLDPSLNRSSFASMSSWFEAFNRQTRQFDMPVERAILGGRLSQNVGFAFASGYQSAIEALFASPFQSGFKLSSLCVTEAAGNHPRAIETCLIEENGCYFVSGDKDFVSGANDSQQMFIACKTGNDDQGRPKLKVVSVMANSEGVDIQALPALGFIPEVSHGKVHFEQVAISASQILAGDGYTDYIRPFRTYEDLHVLAAVVGYRLGEAINLNWGDANIEAHLPLLLSLQAIASMDLSSPSAHIALSACRTQLSRLLAETDAVFEKNNPQEYALWKRDRVLLKVASKAHYHRTEKAWAYFRQK